MNRHCQNCGVTDLVCEECGADRTLEVYKVQSELEEANARICWLRVLCQAVTEYFDHIKDVDTCYCPPHDLYDQVKAAGNRKREANP